ncbi:MAG: glycosyltransferase [Opitutae bacterium]|nr:glycosyltransferase [Opitutae bacterium]
MSPSSVTVVIPIFNEEPVLPELLARLAAVFDAQPGTRWTALLVDDGSRDQSAGLVRAHAAQDKRFALLELSRNFGFQAAIAAGLANATGDAVAGPRRLGLDIFHRFFNRFTDFPIEANTGTFGLLDRAAVDALNALPERNRFFPGLRAWVGFPSAEVLYDRQERAAGQPQQTLRRLVRYAFDGLFSFSYLPLRLLTYAGVGISLCGFALGVFYISRRLFGVEVAATGFTTLVTLTLFIGGVQLIGIGILGEYLARVYDEVKQRPAFILKRRDRVD